MMKAEKDDDGYNFVDGGGEKKAEHREVVMAEEEENPLSTTADPISTTSMDDTFSAMRKSSFAGRHRGHHRITASKLSAAERSRIIFSETRRREAVKAEERERKRRHRLARDKRTFYERIRGINSQRRSAYR